MSLRSLLISHIAESLTSEARLNRRRKVLELKRRRAGKPHVVSYFHQADDPYSCLLAQILPQLADQYDVCIDCYLVSPPQDAAAPERQLLAGWSRQDASLLAKKAGIVSPSLETQPPPDRVALAERRLAASITEGRFIAEAGRISLALWSDGDLGGREAEATAIKAEGDAVRLSLGHYLGGTLNYEGEWYWGLDRLHFLEERLAGLGARRAKEPLRAIYPQPSSPRADAARTEGGELHYYLSFRSPYTYIVAERVKALADAYGLELKLRFVLPMVMRGLPVPRAKRNYITMDAAREARRLGVPFGRVADPVGRPVERGYSLLPWAIDQGRGYEYCHAFMRAVWSQGVDAGTDNGLRSIVEEAGLSWRLARPLIGTEGWREQAEANRKELTALGLWGVPCFRFEDTAVWGQDRLWVIEDAIRARRA